LAATPETCYPWFSATKLFTATAVLQLVEARKLSLDEPVAQCLSDLPIADAAPITPRQLLSHTSGLVNPMPLRWAHLATEPGPELEAMTRRLLSRHSRLRFEPGARYAYSNLGYLVLGLLIERLSGQKFEDYVVRNVLSPLAAASAGFVLPPEAACGYSRAWSLMGVTARLILDRRFFGPTTNGYTALRRFKVDGAPYGGLVGTATDLLRLGQAMLRHGTGTRGPVLGPSSVHLALSPVQSLRGEKLAIGLGWHLGEANGVPYANHLGGGAGFRSELRIYPRIGAAIAIIANETSFDTTPLARMVVDA
jgi:CubicO group peptidase (beta-lactamase class C family)